jgi:hypothetical protein
MTLQYLVKRRRQRSTVLTKEINPEFVKDILISHLQSIYSEEIVDIDIPVINTIKIYLKKGLSRTRKD